MKLKKTKKNHFFCTKQPLKKRVFSFCEQNLKITKNENVFEVFLAANEMNKFALA